MRRRSFLIFSVSVDGGRPNFRARRVSCLSRISPASPALVILRSARAIDGFASGLECPRSVRTVADAALEESHTVRA